MTGRGRKKEKKSKLAGERLGIARSIFGLTYDNFVDDARWEKLVRIFDPKTVRLWVKNGIPLRRLAAVAEYFGIPEYYFTDTAIKSAHFERELYRAKTRLKNPQVSPKQTAGNGRTPPTGHSAIEMAGYTYFRARPEKLGRAFDSFIADRTGGFIGRRFIFDELDVFLTDTDQSSGYIIIKGEPGIGKSAFLAELVKERGYIHHFNIAPQAINKPKLFLNNVCAQLVSSFGLDHIPWPPDADRDGAFLNQLLSEAANRLKEESQLVVAVDALDEVEHNGLSARENLLYLPQALPAGVFFIVTTRCKYDIRLHVSSAKHIDLEADSPLNIKDAQRYIRFQAKRPQMKKRIAEWGVTADQFIETVLEKSAGNFMYLRYVLPALETGRFITDEVDELPEGLKGYYRSHWRQMQAQEPEAFEGVYRPVVCILAAAQEAISPEQIARFTGIAERSVRQVIRKWYEFLHDESDGSGLRLYRIYHTTFQEFLQEEVDPGLKSYHAMIVDYYDRLLA